MHPGAWQTSVYFRETKKTWFSCIILAHFCYETSLRVGSIWAKISLAVFEICAFEVCLLSSYFFCNTYHNPRKYYWILFKLGGHKEHYCSTFTFQFVCRLVKVVQSYYRFSKITSKINYKLKIIGNTILLVYLVQQKLMQPEVIIDYYLLLLTLYSDQHWRSTTTCAAALGLPNLVSRT